MQKTREEIKRSCLKLLEEKPLNQVTVKAIVEDCGISRNSFYYYYSDIPTLLSDIVMESADRIILEHADMASLGECLDAVTQFARENKRAMLHVFKSANRDLYERSLAKVCHDVVEAYFKTVYGEVEVDETDGEIMIRFYQCELLGQILLWLESDMQYDIQKQYSRLLELRGDFAPEMLRRSAEEKAKNKQD